MKKVFIIVTAAVATIACTKEANIEEKSLATEGGLISIEATVSPFVDDETKASISTGEGGAVTGTFTWSEGDQIAFPVTESPEYVALTYNPENGKFEGKANDGQAIDNTRQIVYPASRVIGGSYSTTFASIAEAKAGFKMTASVPASLSQKITMTHESALVHIQFTNVPDFTDKLVVSDGSSNVASVSIGETSGTVDFYVPVTPDGSKPYSFSLEDSNGNVIKRVSKTKSLAAGNYYNTPAVPVGHVIRVIDEVDWGSREIYIWNSANTSENKCFTVSSAYPYQLLTNDSHNHYIVIPSELSWATATTKVGVKFQDAGATHSTQTDGVYLLRSFTFTVPSGLGMQTDYRIYPRSSTKTSLNLFITKPTSLITSSTDKSWSNYEVYWWSNKTGYKNEPWGNWDTRKNIRLALGTQEIPSSLIGYASDSGLIIGDIDSAEEKYKPQLNTCFYGDIYANLTSSGISISEDLNTKRISEYWPGTSVSSVSSTINASAYFTFDRSYYGNRVWTIISDGGSAQTSVWELTINQDYDYNY